MCIRDRGVFGYAGLKNTGMNVSPLAPSIPLLPSAPRGIPKTKVYGLPDVPSPSNLAVAGSVGANVVTFTVSLKLASGVTPSRPQGTTIRISIGSSTPLSVATLNVRVV